MRQRNFNSLPPVSFDEIFAEDEKKKDAEFHNILRNLCVVCTDEEPDLRRFSNLENWEEVKKYNFVNDTNDLFCRLFKKGDKVVIVFYCHFPQFSCEDVYNHLSRGWAIPQFKQAYEYFKKIKSRFTNSKVYLTGSNIGGSTAQFVGLYNKDIATVTFNAVGIGCLYPQLIKTYMATNITNYVSSNVSKILREKHLGEVKIIYKPQYIAQDKLPKPENNSRPEINNLFDFDNLKFFKSSCNALA